MACKSDFTLYGMLLRELGAVNFIGDFLEENVTKLSRSTSLYYHESSVELSWKLLAAAGEGEKKSTLRWSRKRWAGKRYLPNSYLSIANGVIGERPFSLDDSKKVPIPMSFGRRLIDSRRREHRGDIFSIVLSFSTHYLLVEIYETLLTILRTDCS